MAVYKFLNTKEKMIKKEFKSYVEAQQYAKEKGLLCLAMDGKTFNKAFQIKIEAFKDHPKYAYLKKQADNAIIQNMGAGFSSIRANDFMKRIIVLPKDYIRDWLDGKNKLEWLEEYK